MSDWHYEVFENEKKYLIEGHQIDSNCCDKCDRSEHGKIEKYEAKNYTLGCRICGTLTGEHGFSFDSKRVE